jgi:GNAT superfamily N-acetyltransferase
MPEFLIQRWTSAERLDDIMAMVHAAFADITPPSGVLSETTADLAARQRDGVVLVAMVGGDFVGSLFCARKGDALYLTRMATRPDWRKRGVGRALMREAQAEARAAGLGKLLIRVRKSLPGNLAYFTAKGFVVTGEGQDPGREPYDVMERVLI